MIDSFIWRLVDSVWSSGFVDEVLEAFFLVSVPPVVEGSSGDLCAGVDLTDRRPLPSSSYAPASESHNVSGLLHEGTLGLSSYECATCCGLLQVVVGLAKLKYLLAHFSSCGVH